jgi:hypothetical protein
VTDWDSLKLDLSIRILPGNVQDIRLDCPSYCLKAGPSSFRNTVRISMDLSVISVVLVSSRRTRGLVSINLITNGVLQLLVVIFIMWRTHRDPGALVQEAGEKASQLIKAIRAH